MSTSTDTNIVDIDLELNTPIATPALDYVQEIVDEAYSLWRQNDWSWDRFILHLSYPQKVAVLTGKLYQQVTNGGFCQWEDNGYGTEESVRGLLRIIQEMERLPECTEWCSLVKETIISVNSIIHSEVASRYGGRYGYDEEDEEENGSELSLLDSEFYSRFKTDEDFFTPVAKYLQHLGS